MNALGRLDRGRPPASGPVQRYRFPEFERHRLAAGPQVLLARVPRAPLVSMRWLVQAGAACDPSDRAGLATLTASLLDDGTRTRGAEQISDAIESLGGALFCGADWDTAGIEIGAPSRHLGAGIALLLETATESSFPESELARALSLRRNELLRRRTQPGAQADLALARGLFGEGTYGRSIYGDEQSLERLTRDDIERLYAERHVGAGATLIVAGDVVPSEVLSRLGDLLVADGRLAPPRPPITDTAGQRRVLVLDRPDSPQTELRVGWCGVSRLDPDYPAMRCLATLVGGKYTSRLNLVLRQELGLTYGVSCTQAARWGRGPFAVSTAIATDGVGRAVMEILNAIEALRDTPPPANELGDTVAYLTGTFPFTLQTVGGIADRLEEIATFDLDDDAVDRYQAELLALQADQLSRAAGRHLLPDLAVIVAVGDAARLEPQLAAFGEVERITAS